MEKMTKREKLVELLQGDLDLAKLTIREINSYNGQLDYLEVHENDEEFFDTYFDGNVMKVARSICYGDYRYTDDLVRFNSYGNLESLDNWQYDEEVISNLDDIASAIEDSFDSRYCDLGYEIMEIMNEEEEEEEE